MLFLLFKTLAGGESVQILSSTCLSHCRHSGALLHEKLNLGVRKWSICNLHLFCLKRPIAILEGNTSAMSSGAVSFLIKSSAQPQCRPAFPQT